MVFGIGTDIVQIARMAGSLQRHGKRIARRILDRNELTEFEQALHPARFLAKRFAAKEAAAKALGTGFRDGLYLRHIAVRHNHLGQPELVLTGKAQELLRQHGIERSFISIADEADYALAFVVLEQ